MKIRICIIIFGSFLLSSCIPDTELESDSDCTEEALIGCETSANETNTETLDDQVAEENSTPAPSPAAPPSPRPEVQPPQQTSTPFVTLVSGVFEDGQNLTIQGVNFKTRPNQSPIIWDQFENGRSNELLADSSNWLGYNEKDGAIYSNSEAYSGALSVSNTPTDPGNDFMTNFQTFAPTDTVYLSYMFKWVDNNNPEYQDPEEFCGRDRSEEANDILLYGILKLSRITSTGSNNGDHYNGPGTSAQTLNPYGSCSAYATLSNESESPTFYGAGRIYKGIWQRLEVTYHLPTSTHPGSVNYFVDNNTGRLIERSDYVTRNVESSYKLDSVLLGLMMPNTKKSLGADMTLYIDDVYVDNTPARIEMCESNQWENCHKKFIQIVSSWSDSSISFKANKAAMIEGTDYYLYVIDKDENVSSAYGPF